VGLSLRQPSVRSQCEHVFAHGPRGMREVLPVRGAEARHGLLLAAQGEGPTRHVLSPLPLGVWQGALRGEPATVHRPGAGTETAVSSRAHRVPDRLFQDASVCRLWRGRSGRPGV
jgi:hypothetical protein